MDYKFDVLMSELRMKADEVHNYLKEKLVAYMNDNDIVSLRKLSFGIYEEVRADGTVGSLNMELQEMLGRTEEIPEMLVFELQKGKDF